jgi:hypothetical protein
MPPRNAAQATSPDLSGDAPSAVDTTALAANAASAGGVQPIDIPTPRAASDAPRASARGTYRDRNGDLRVVGAGDPIPDGWSLVEETDLEARAAGTPTAQEDGVAAATTAGGADPQALVDAEADRDAARQEADDLRAQLAQAQADKEAAEKAAADAAKKGSAKS